MKIDIPKPRREVKELFAKLVPRDSRVTTKRVFGNDAAFVNRNMFFGIYGKDVFVRLPEANAKVLLGEKGSKPFEPVPGHAMRGYYMVPHAWKSRLSETRKWVTISLEWASSLPEKKAKR